MKEFRDKSTQDACSEQELNQVVDLFISHLQSKATIDQQKRLLALLEEIEANGHTQSKQAILPRSLQCA